MYISLVLVNSNSSVEETRYNTDIYIYIILNTGTSCAEHLFAFQQFVKA